MNKVILLGRLTKDVENRYTQNNMSISTFTIAVNRMGKAQDGEPTADFFNVVSFKQTADFVAKHFCKGLQVLVEGHLKNDNWTDKEGNKRYKTEVMADQVYFADKKHEMQEPEPELAIPKSDDDFFVKNEDSAYEDLPF